MTDDAADVPGGKRASIPFKPQSLYSGLLSLSDQFNEMGSFLMAAHLTLPPGALECRATALEKHWPVLPH